MQDEDGQSVTHRVRIEAGGWITIPAEALQELGVGERDVLLLTRDRHGIRFSTIRQAVREAQAYFKQFKRPGRGVVDELIRERREEAAREGREPSEMRGEEAG